MRKPCPSLEALELAVWATSEAGEDVRPAVLQEATHQLITLYRQGTCFNLASKILASEIRTQHQMETLTGTRVLLSSNIYAV